MAFEQTVTSDAQHYAGLRSSGSSSVYGSTHLYLQNKENNRIQAKLIQKPDGNIYSRLTILDECSTLGELLRTEMAQHKDVLVASYTTAEAAEYTLTFECLSKKHPKLIFQEVCRKINMELFELFQDIQTKQFKRFQLNPTSSTPLLLRGKIKNVRTSLVNALRRSILEDLPSLAIHTVRIKESKCVLDDGNLSDRLSLVPIDCTDIDKLIHKDDCLCDDYCDKCSATLQLREKHPIDSGSLNPWMVTDLDLVSLNHKTIRPATQSIENEAERFKRRINLAPIAPGQEIDLQAIVKLGIGRQHAKFKPACRVVFVPNRHVTIHYDVLEELKLTDDELKWFVNECPTQVFGLASEIKKNDSKERISKTTSDIENVPVCMSSSSSSCSTPTQHNLAVVDHDRCMACQTCIVASKTLINKKIPEDQIKTRMENNTLKPIATYEVFGQQDQKTDFRFAIQSVGGMMPLQILLRGMNVLVQRITTFSSDLERSVF